MKDASGKTAVVEFSELSTTLTKYVTITDALARSGALDPGFDANQVASVVFVMDKDVAAAATGTLTITSAGLQAAPGAFSYPGIKWVATSGSSLSNLSALSPAVGAIASSPDALSSLSSSSTSTQTNVTFGYNMTQTGAYAGASLKFGSLLNLTNNPQEFQVSGTASSIKAVLKDNSGRTVVVGFQSVSPTTAKFFPVTADIVLAAAGGAVNFDITQIASITFLVDDPSAATGTVTIGIKGLPEMTASRFTNPSGFMINADQSTPPPPASLLAGSSVTAGTFASTAARLTNFTTTSDSVAFTYSGISTTTDYAGFQLSLGTPWDLTNDDATQNPLVFSLKNSAATTTPTPTNNMIKVVLKDGIGRAAVLTLNGVTNGVADPAQKFTITAQDVVSSVGVGNFDTDHVVSVTFVADKEVVSGNGTVTLTTDAFAALPVSFSYAGGIKMIAPSTGDPGLSNLGSSGIGLGTVASAAAKLTGLNLAGDSVGFSYSITAASADYAGAQFNFNTRWNLSGTSPLVFSVQNAPGTTGTAITKVKAVLKDASGKTAVVELTGITNAGQKFTITQADVIASAGAGNFDTSNVASVTFLVDKDVLAGTGTTTGTVTVESLNLSAATLPAGMVLTTSTAVASVTTIPVEGITNLGNVIPQTVASGAGVLTALSATPTTVTLGYKIASAGQYAGAKFAAAADFPWNLTSSGLVFGLKTSTTSNAKVKAVLTDKDGKTSVVQFTGLLSTSTKYVTITKAAAEKSAGAGNFDASQIISVVFVMDKDVAAVADGTLTI
ncbi:MAG: hypothetical protein WCK89_10975, partial [bacterium]